MRPYRRIGIVAASLLAAIVAVAPYWSEQSARRARNLLRAAGVDTQAVDLDPLSGKLRISGLSTTRGGVRLSARRIVVPVEAAPFALFAPAFAREGVTEADDIEFVSPLPQSGAIAIRVPHVEAVATALTDSDLVALIDPKSAMTFAERLKRLSAASIAVPTVIVDVRGNDLSGRAVYRNLTMVDVSAGNIGALAVGGGSMNITPRDAPAPVEGKFGTLVARGLDLGLAARIAAGPRDDASAEWKTFLELISFDGFEIKAADRFQFGLGKILGRNIRARPTRVALENMLEAWREGAYGPDDLLSSYRLLAEICDSLAVGSLELRDYAVAVKDGPGEIRTGFTRAAVAGFSQGRLADFTLDGSAVETSQGHLKLGTLAIHGLSFKPAFEALALRPAELDLRNLLPTVGTFMLADLDADLPTAVPGDSTKEARNAFQIKRVELDTSDFLRNLPTALSLSVDGFAFKVDPDNPQTAVLSNLGYKKIAASARFAARWNPSTREIAIPQAALALPEIGALTVTGTIANVPKDLFVGSAPVAEQALGGAVIKTLDAKIDNLGLFERVLTRDAQEAGLSPDQRRGEYISAIALALPRLFGNLPAASALVSAVVKFIGEPKSLHIVAKSPQGIGIADFPPKGDPGALLGKIDLTVTANE